jgi:aspartate racemase
MAGTLGIIGGMSWVSTQAYYRLVNEQVAAARGRQHSAELLVASVDFQPIVDAQARGDWARAGEILADRGRALERAGATVFLIASNTMHLVYDAVRTAVSIPGLDIFDATAGALRGSGMRRVGLLGTRYTMSHPFFVEAYARRGVEVLVPKADDAKLVNEIIFRELIHGRVEAASVARYRDVVARLGAAGAEAVVLGCTQISLLLKPGDTELPLFDTTALHASMAAGWLLA